MSWGRFIIHITVRIALCACLVLTLTGAVTPAVVFGAPTLLGRPGVGIPQDQPAKPEAPSLAGQRVVLSDVTNTIVPQASNIWQCSCDTDGCWPGCFTIASATILKYWAGKGFPRLWDGDENGTLHKLRDVFPNLFCYNNKNDDGIPSDVGYDAYDVAKGLDTFAQQRGYKLGIRAIPAPKFKQIVAEIDAGRPVIGAFGLSPWGSHAGTIIGYDTTGGRQVMIVRPNLLNRNDTELNWGEGYGEFGIVTIAPSLDDSGGAAPALDVEVVVNDADPGFSATGSWMTATTGFGNQAHYTQTTDPSNLGPREDTAVATWKPVLPVDGLWEVYTWIPRDDTDDTAVPLATYRINSAEGQSLVRRTQNKAHIGWMPLGTYPFVRGERGTVQLGNMTGDNPLKNVWADAMRFVWRAPLAVQSEAGGPAYIVLNGMRRSIPDAQTMDALKVSLSQVRKLTALEMDQYPPDEMMPSVLSEWVGAYYNNTLLSSPASSLNADASLNFRWNGAAPASGVDAQAFSARWTRYLAMNEGEYPFSINAVGGVRLWIDGQLQINDWDTQRGIFIKHDKTVALASGLHRVDVDYVNRDNYVYAQISFGNLPPNIPFVIDPTAGMGWTSSPTTTLHWQDAGDVDAISGDKPRRFLVTAWNPASGWRVTSGWTESTEWTVSWPQDGHYLWSVVASDGQATSGNSQPLEVRVDRTPPWAQMVSASASAPQGGVQAAPIPPAGLPIQDGATTTVPVLQGGATAPIPVAPSPAQPSPTGPLTVSSEPPGLRGSVAPAVIPIPVASAETGTPVRRTTMSAESVTSAAPAAAPAAAAAGRVATPGGEKMIDAYRVVTDANGTMIVQPGGVQVASQGTLNVAPPAGVPIPDPNATSVTSQLGNLPGIRLVWSGKYGFSATGDGLHYDVQVREKVHASTTYTLVVENQEVKRLATALTLSGTSEITTPVMITEVVPVTTVSPLVLLSPLTDSQWVTFAAGIVQTETVFLGNPGSTYEFRVRATDPAGNSQDWYDGYSVQATIDPKTITYRVVLPLIQR